MSMNLNSDVDHNEKFILVGRIRPIACSAIFNKVDRERAALKRPGVAQSLSTFVHDAS